MRRIWALGTMGLMAVLATTIVTRAQDGPGRVARWEGPPRLQDHGPAGGFGHRGMAWGRAGRGFGGGERLLRLADNPRMRTYLNLTDEQVSRLHRIGVDAQKTAVQTRANLQLRRIEMRELLRADNPDQNAILKKVDEVSALRAQMARQNIQTLLAARNVLTPDQQKKLRSVRPEHAMGGFGPQHRMEHRGGYGAPAGAPGAPAGAPPAAGPDAPAAQ